MITCLNIFTLQLANCTCAHFQIHGCRTVVPMEFRIDPCNTSHCPRNDYQFSSIIKGFKACIELVECDTIMNPPGVKHVWCVPDNLSCRWIISSLIIQTQLPWIMKALIIPAMFVLLCFLKKRWCCRSTRRVLAILYAIGQHASPWNSTSDISIS